MSDNNTSGGIGFCGVLTAIFITLKLCGVIGWSWWWVMSPIWITALLITTILIVASILIFKKG